MFDAVSAAGVDGLASQHIDDRLLERRGDVGDGDDPPGGPLGLYPPGDRGLESGEREVETMPLHVPSRRQTPGEVDDDRSVPRGPIDVWPARKWQPEHPGHLVERLPRRIVDRRPEGTHVAGHIGHEQER